MREQWLYIRIFMSLTVSVSFFHTGATVVINTLMWPVSASSWPDVKVWGHHTYNESSMAAIKQLYIKNSEPCIPIPTDRPLMFLMNRTLTSSQLQGHKTVIVYGKGLQYVPRTCADMPILVLQSQDTCESDGKTPFCSHPKSCILSSHDSSSCSFSCNIESMPGPFNMRIGVHFRQDGRAHPGIKPELCYVNLYGSAEGPSRAGMGVSKAPFVDFTVMGKPDVVRI